jgi:hypothetical protein
MTHRPRSSASITEQTRQSIIDHLHEGEQIKSIAFSVNRSHQYVRKFLAAVGYRTMLLNDKERAMIEAARKQRKAA